MPTGNSVKPDKGFWLPKTCHARRHMPPWVFVNYDAAVAILKAVDSYKPGDPLYWYGKVTTLANANVRSADQETDAIKWLVKFGWWVPQGDQRRRQRGKWSTNRYRILEHSEYEAVHRFEELPYGCAPYPYDPDSGEQIYSIDPPPKRAGLCMFEGCDVLLERGEYCKTHRNAKVTVGHIRPTDGEA